MLVEAILRCLIKLVHLLDKNSIFLKHLFWISVVVMQVCMCMSMYITSGLLATAAATKMYSILSGPHP